MFATLDDLDGRSSCWSSRRRCAAEGVLQPDQIVLVAAGSTTRRPARSARGPGRQGFDPREAEVEKAKATMAEKAAARGAQAAAPGVPRSLRSGSARHSSSTLCPLGPEPRRGTGPAPKAALGRRSRRLLARRPARQHLRASGAAPAGGGTAEFRQGLRLPRYILVALDDLEAGRLRRVHEARARDAMAVLQAAGLAIRRRPASPTSGWRSRSDWTTPRSPPKRSIALRRGWPRVVSWRSWAGAGSVRPRVAQRRCSDDPTGPPLHRVRRTVALRG